MTDTDTNGATGPEGAGTGDATATGATQGQPPSDATGAQGGQDAPDTAALQKQIDDLGKQLTDSQEESRRVAAGAEGRADDRVRRAMETRDRQDRKGKLAAEGERIAGLEAKAAEGDAEAIRSLAQIAQRATREPVEQADMDTEKANAYVDGMARVFNLRSIRLAPPEDVKAQWLTMFGQGNYEGVTEAMDKFAASKNGTPPANPNAPAGKTVPELEAELATLRTDAENRQINDARGGGGPDLGGGGGGGKQKGYEGLTQEEEAAMPSAERDASTAEFMREENVPA